MTKTDKLAFRCIHRHSAESHPKCYEKYIAGDLSIKNSFTPKHNRSARILLLDIETLPGEYYAFDPHVDYLPPTHQIKDWSVVCWAAKWLFDPEIFGKCVSHKDAYDRHDLSILDGIWKLMDEADIIITQNGINFDIKKLNSRFIQYQIFPPAKFLNVDVFRVAKAVFGFSYNRLDELGKKFGIGSKTKMEFQDWKNCLTNDKAADESIHHMLDYCKRDVAPLLEDVYLNMLPYIPNHPNLNLFTTHDADVCPKCESADIAWNTKPYATPQGLWMSFRCNACGSTGRGTRKEYSIKKSGIKS